MIQYLNFLNTVKVNFIGGPKVIQMRWFINLFKGATWAYVLFLMWFFKNFSLGAYLYFALHGSYGLIWVLKDVAFPDRSWEHYVTIPSAFAGSALLILYWIIGFLQISGNGIDNPSNSRIVTALLSYIFGVVLMMITDCQKYFTLKYKPGLITEGMFKYNRNPNFTGEMMLYAAFAMLTGNFYSYLILAIVWTGLFYPLMQQKEISFSKKAGWDKYKKQSYLVLWKIFPNDLANYGLYGLCVAGLWLDYQQGGYITKLKS